MNSDESVSYTLAPPMIGRQWYNLIEQLDLSQVSSVETYRPFVDTKTCNQCAMTIISLHSSWKYQENKLTVEYITYYINISTTSFVSPRRVVELVEQMIFQMEIFQVDNILLYVILIEQISWGLSSAIYFFYVICRLYYTGVGFILYTFLCVVCW